MRRLHPPDYAGHGAERSPATRAGADWNTRQESNLRALGSKPNGDAGNPRLVYWIRRQESDLRGLHSERSWDASNPHLNDLAGRQGIEPYWPVLETSLLPEDNPNWRRAVSPSHMPRAARSAFQTAPGPAGFTLQIGGRR